MYAVKCLCCGRSAFEFPPENFYLSFEEYCERMFAKYGASDYDFMIPIEE